MGVQRNGREHWEATTLQVIRLFHSKLITMGKVQGFPELADLSCCCSGSCPGTAEESALRQSPGGDVAGWIVTAVLCSAVTAYAQHSEPEKDMMLSSHTLSSQQPSGEWGDGQVKCVRQRREAKLSVNGNSREKKNVYEKGKRRRCAKWQKGREGSEQNAEGGKRPVTVTGDVFLSVKGSSRKKV